MLFFWRPVIVISDNQNFSTEDAYLLLNGMKKLGPVSVRKLLLAFDGDPRKILLASRSKLLSVDGIGQGMVDSILANTNEKWLENEKKAIASRGVEFLTQKSYPELLKQIYDPPIGLYLKGCIPSIPSIAIVGTRQPSLYGRRICQELASGLAEEGLCIVSGMARGIDSIAHTSALAVDGRTLAFLGSGIDIIYPPENIKLYREISEKGAVISEFPLGRKADKRTFPMRNRLVSGISSAVIVIESAASGGSLITAQFAAEQGRIVFAVPGRVDQPESAGCNHLIRDGAILARNTQDIIDEIKDSILGGITFSKKGSNETANDQNFQNKAKSENLNLEEKEVFSILKDGSCLDLNEMIEKSNLSFSQLSSTLTMMEINGILGKRADGKFELK